MQIFEETTSVLYCTNDGRLRVERVEVEGHGSSNRAFAIELDGVEVLRTFRREIADAFLAGYDLARENEADPKVKLALEAIDAERERF